MNQYDEYANTLQNTLKLSFLHLSFSLSNHCNEHIYAYITIHRAPPSVTNSHRLEFCSNEWTNALTNKSTFFFNQPSFLSDPLRFKLNHLLFDLSLLSDPPSSPPPPTLSPSPFDSSPWDLLLLPLLKLLPLCVFTTENDEWIVSRFFSSSSTFHHHPNK